jgi:hypothetical protein
MSEPRWKAHERMIARLLGGQRQPITGRPSPDVLTNQLAVEVKLRSRIPQWLEQAVHQAEVAAKERGLTPLLVIVTPRGRGRPPLRLAILRLDTLVTLTKAGGDGG